MKRDQPALPVYIDRQLLLLLEWLLERFRQDGVCRSIYSYMLGNLKQEKKISMNKK